jgi:hypothetical protein
VAAVSEVTLLGACDRSSSVPIHVKIKTQGTVICLLCGCETWSRTSREEQEGGV